MGKRRSEILRSLSADEIQELLEDWIEAYETGWRPSVFVAGTPERRYKKYTEMLQQAHAASGLY